MFAGLHHAFLRGRLPGAWELERGKKFRVQGHVAASHAPRQGLPARGKPSPCRVPLPRPALLHSLSLLCMG